MNDFINIINIGAILVFVLTYYNVYKKSSYIFGLLFLPFTFWMQLLISSAYIETGTYLIDFKQYSYATGSTIRLFLLLEIQMIIFLIESKRIEKKIVKIEQHKSSYRYLYNICFICIIFALYLLIDIILFPPENRFTYYSRTRHFPLINIVSYFSYTMTFIMGYIVSKYKNNKIKFLTLLYLILTIFCLYLKGVQFGGFSISIIMFFCPTIIELAKKKKIIKIRYIVATVFIILVLLIPKYNFYTKTTMYNSIGINNAYEKLIYRAFSQGADLTWVIDKQIVNENKIDYKQFWIELSGFINGEENNTGAYYLMNRSCPSSVLEVYLSGTASITGGYPIIWAAIFGYWGSIIPIIVDGLLFTYLMYKIALAIKKERFFVLVMLIFIYNQCYSIIMSSGISYLGNLIPKLFLTILLILDLIHKPIVFKKKN